MDSLNILQALASLQDINPNRTVATFIFADDKPNMNGQGLPFSEFEKVAKNAIGMPVKMRFTGFGTENHEGSIPIGTIQEMEIKTISDDFHQLVAKAVLWSAEYPEEIAWLKKAYAEGKAPGISYEIGYTEFDNKEGTHWIKDAYTEAATFVKTPAYGARTALIALASLKEEELKTEIIDLAAKLTANDKGGNQMDEKELNALKEERDTFKAEASSKQSLIDDLNKTLSEKDTTIADLETRVKSMELNALTDKRLREYTEAGFTLEAEAEKAEKRKSLFSSLSEEQWGDYLADLKAVKDAAKPAAPQNQALASLRTTLEIPKPDNGSGDSIDFAGLKAGLRDLARQQ